MRSLALLVPLSFACLPTEPAGDSAEGSDGGSEDGDSTTADAPTEVRVMVGPEGGVVEGLGVHLGIPADALGEAVEIVVRTDAD
ncbi:MAG: hypothetical protein JNK45_26010, partial [Myxococcales bacterium]|nr:hypothetical protein [Myxococcales bacterium]